MGESKAGPDESSFGDEIAIVGMAGRFPGAGDIATFWRQLLDGVESISQFSPAELDDSFDDAVRTAPNFVAAHGVLDGVDQFDAGFFGMYPREAALTDPQHRVFLECCWEALEDGACDPSRFGGAIGVFAGCSMNTYFLQHVCHDRATLEEFTSNFQLGMYPALLGAGREFLATRVSYKLDLRGPSFTVQSACSTSLLAIAQACQSLQLYQCDAALAGGVSITFPQQRGYLHVEGGMGSVDGHCRPFDAEAGGTVFGSGAGVVLLKRLADALADGNPVYAVIRGCGINNDGAAKIGYTAPSIDGQVGAIEMALEAAGVAPASVGYIECHGTATPLGDPVEVAALRRAYGSGGTAAQACALGSVKGNIGHLDAAAGVAGLIKAAMCVREGVLPPTVHFRRANPQLDLEHSPFYVNARLREWASQAPRRAAVSALGVGGTNVHVVLEQAPAATTTPPESLPQLLVLSARDADALDAARQRLAAHLRAHPQQRLDEVAWTLQAGRRRFEHRTSIVAADHAQAIARLEASVTTTTAPAVRPRVVFMFPGQGAQHAQMARELYDAVPTFAADLDRCAGVLAPLLGFDLLAALYDDPSADEAGDVARRNTLFAQTALFSIEYALARLWIRWGIAPDAMIGHSVGEFVAATIAGVLSLEDALAIVAARARLMQQMPAGAMLAVRLPEAQLRPLLPATLSIAAVNAPDLCVVAGAEEAITAFEAAMSARDLICRRLHTAHAFHSPAVDPIVAPLHDEVVDRSLRAPTLRYVSCVSGTWISDTQATSADYWARHAREPVRFADGIATLLADDAPLLLLEVGPGRTLSTLAARCAPRDRARVWPSLRAADAAGGDLETLLLALGGLWAAGCEADWQSVHGGTRRHFAHLPTYPFQRHRHWIDAPAPIRGAGITSSTPIEESSIMSATPAAVAVPRADAALIRELGALLEALSGQSVDGFADDASFLEMGFDSLFLTQFAQKVQARFGVRVTFRQLLGERPSRAALAALLIEQNVQLPETTAAAPAGSGAATFPTSEPIAAGLAAASAGIDGLFREQMQTMSRLFERQLAALGAVPAPHAAGPSPSPSPVAAASAAPPPDGDARETGGSRFQVYSPTRRHATQSITAAQRRHIDELVARCTASAASSKADTQLYRKVLADPRAAAGFRAEWKELVYPLICTRAEGSRLWDADGNVYIDLVNGYGQTFFGHAPDFVVDAVKAQLEKGFAIGPQAELAGPLAASFSALTGCERVTFCNTGSEAVMAAMRVARAVTGRDRVVMFGGDYHGQFDEVLVKGVRRAGLEPQSMPAASGIPAAAVANIVVLDYGSDESLQWICDHAGELAAVVVEPVQSRHPDLQPFEFLRTLRRVTEAAGIALVIDEVVTGFRVHPAGIQGLIGIRADLATYGKVIGGGLPIGILAGKARFMDALDGGSWRYGDESFPETGVTFFAGTFVRHPLVLAAAAVVLERIRSEGPQLQERLAARTATLVAELRALFARYGVDAPIEQFSSLFYFNLHGLHALAPLLYHHLRLRGVNLQDGFPCFLTTAHSDADLGQIVAAFDDSLAAMAAVGIFTPAPSAVSETELPLSESQLEIWLAAQLGDEASCAFNESVSVQLDGALDRDALQAALDTLVARHDALRLRFAPSGEFQYVADAEPLLCPYADLAGDDAHAGPRMAALVALDAATPFDLVAGPVVRAQLLRLAPQRHVLLLTAHHIVCDGWSINVLIEELRTLYAAFATGERGVLQPAPRFVDYVRREAARDAQALDATEAYWLGLYAELPPPLDLPTDRPRPVPRRFEGGTRTRMLDASLMESLRKAGARHGSTLFATLLAAFQLLLGRLAGSQDVVVGVPTAGQSHAGEPGLVGHCVNFLPLRVRWTADMATAQLLREAGRIVLDAQDHQDYTFGTLLRQLALPRLSGRLPLTEVQFNLERLGAAAQAGTLMLTTTPNAKAYVNFDLFLNVIESPQGLRLDCDYNCGLFDAQTIDGWLDCYQMLLESIAADTTQPLRRLNWLRASPAHSATTVPPGDVCAHQLVEAQARRFPDADALRCDDRHWSYAELDQNANRVAQYLHAAFGGRRGLVAVAVCRSEWLPTLLLGIWKAGCAYVPLDLSHPVARLEQVVREADVLAVLTDAGAYLNGLCTVVPTIDLTAEANAIAACSASAPDVAVDAGDLAYVIYTSGSTGTPKGVEIAHRSLVNLLESMASEPGLVAGERLLATTTVAFDIAGLELFLPLSVGACTVVATGEDLADGFRLLERLHLSGAQVMQATPSLWRVLLEAGFVSWPGLRMMCGGEALTRELADRLLAGGGRLWNLYGPTETTIWSSCIEVRADSLPVTVGRPIANTQFYILDANGVVLPAGVPGELHIGGAGVALGYHRRPQLSDERFVPNPFGNGRLYRTGDLAQQLPNGETLVLGRLDAQVKLRGHRVELGEVEAVLGRIAGIAAAAVVLRDDDGQQALTAFYVPGPQGAADPVVLRSLLSTLLPEYMVPTQWHALKSLPLTPNGKLDKAALVALGLADAPTEDVPLRAPRNALEQQLFDIWREVLGTQLRSIDGDLLALGADSIQLFRIVARARRAGFEIGARDLLRARNVERLAQLLELRTASEAVEA